MARMCVFCESVNDLNTSMTVTLEDGSKASVDICDAHAEDATAKTIRSAFMARQTKIKEFLEQAEKYGLVMSQNVSGLVVANQPAARQPVVQEQAERQRVIVQTDLEPLPEGMVPAGSVNKRLNRMVTSGKSFDGFSAEGSASHNLDDIESKIGGDGGMIKIDVVEGRDGAPLAIQSIKRDNTGTTHVHVVKTSDAEIQKRFKMMAEMSKSGQGWQQIPDFRNGYDLRDCPLCRGKCQVRSRGETIMCPKCEGRGAI